MISLLHARWRVSSCMLALSIVLCLASVSMKCHAGAMILVPESKVHLIRDISSFDVAVPTALLPGDLLSTDDGAAGAQIEDGSGSLVALGAGTQVAIGSPPSGGAGGQLWALSLLSGWLKVAHSVVDPCLPLAIDTSALEINLDKGSLVLHSTHTGVALYIESGFALAAAVGGHGMQQKVTAGHYVEHDLGQPIAMLTRLPAAFVNDMPVAFRDPVGAAPVRAPVQALSGEARKVEYDDIAYWLVSHLELRHTFVSRFQSLAGDKTFVAQIRRHVRDLPDWRPIVFPSHVESRRQTSAFGKRASSRNTSAATPPPTAATPSILPLPSTLSENGL